MIGEVSTYVAKKTLYTIVSTFFDVLYLCYQGIKVKCVGCHLRNMVSSTIAAHKDAFLMCDVFQACTSTMKDCAYIYYSTSVNLARVKPQFEKPVAFGLRLRRLTWI